jgi:hypothetical protein
MKANCPLLLTFLISLSCSSKNGAEFVRYYPAAFSSCIADTNNTYHYVLPEKHNGILPLWIILDSGGDGLLAVNNAKPAVAEIPCVVIGSDLICNNFPGYKQAIRQLIDDACRKYPVSKDLVYIAGFSGGARMAFEFAQDYPVKGVLMCGAGPSPDVLQNLPFPLYMISGATDFNFSEMYYNPLNKSPNSKCFTDFFRGMHEWPPADKLRNGFLFLMGQENEPAKSLAKLESGILEEEADSLLAAGENFFALKALEKAVVLDAANRQVKKKIRKMARDQKIRGQLTRLEKNLELEYRINQAYAGALTEHDSVWWNKELNQLTLEISNHSGENRDHYLRIKAFLGIMLYSQLNHLIRNQPEDDRIVHLLATYRNLEPENPDVYYDYALYEWKCGKKEVAMKHLSTAISLGFKDQKKMKNDFSGTYAHEFMTDAEKTTVAVTK